MRISWAICDDPPFSVREGGILKPGYSDQVDHLRNIRDNGAQAVAELEAKERIRTGIKSSRSATTRCSATTSTCRNPQATQDPR